MEPVKRDGNIREQVEIEHQVRREYPKKWGQVPLNKRNLLYSQDYLNEKIRQTNGKETNPFGYTGHGESHFVSKEMYNSLMATCRCGRPKIDTHITKCLQKEKNNYEVDQQPQPLTDRKIPETSLGMYGWPHNRYAEMEKSTRYISPTYDIPGGKINDRPYSNIFIG